MRSASTKDAGVAAEPAATALEAILEIADSGFIVYDHSGEVRWASRRLRELLDLDDSEWARLRNFPSFSRLLSLRLANHPQSISPPWLLWRPGNGAGREQLELARGDRLLERLARPLNKEAIDSSGWVERYRELSAEVGLSRQALQTQKLAALGQMAAGIAHELNNPLTTVMGYGHLLLEQALEPKALADVQRICREAERAALIVRSLLMLVREGKLERSSVNLNEVVESTVRLCAFELKQAGISVELDLDLSLPLISANLVQLQQMALNLVLNSRQAIGVAGPRGHIALRTRHNGERLFLMVEDDGPGIPPELHSRIFEPFFTTKPPGLGTGLGLSIVSGILRQHGGEIRVASQPGAGASFTVELPLARGEEVELGHSQQLETQPRRAPVSRILVVEDEAGIGQLIVDALAGEGHETEWATEAAEALARAGAGAYDLVICDLKVPQLDAAGLHRLLGSSDRHAQMLLITSDAVAFASPSDWLRESRLPSIAKPFLLTELKAAVARLLVRKRRGASVS